MVKRKTDEGAQFVKFFGPLLDALRKLGGSAAPDEAVEQIATDLALSDEIQNDLLPSGGTTFPQPGPLGRASTLSARACSIHRSEAFGALPSGAA